MKPLFYIFRKTIKNHIKELKKKPGTLILYILLVILMIFMIFTTFHSPAKTSLKGNIEAYRAFATMAILAVLYLGVKQGLDSGSSFFRSADINLVFTAPISSTKVLIYGFIKQLTTTFIFLFFLLFQLPNLRNFFPITAVGVFVILGASFFLVFSLSILGILTYSLTSRSQETRKWIANFSNTCATLFGMALVYKLFVYKDLGKAALDLLNAKFFTTIPFLGWLQTVLMGAVVKITPAFYVNLLLCTGFIALLIYIVCNLNTAYYEDVLAATEQKEELLALKKSGKSNLNFKKGKVRKIKSSNMNLGPSAIFYRQILEYRKSGIPFIDRMTFIMLGTGISSKYIFHTNNINVVLYFTVYMLFFFSVQGKWTQELSKPYIYLLPYSSTEKLFYATVADTIKYAIDGVVLFIATGFMFKSNAVIILLCAVSYTSFGTLYTYGDVFSIRMFGETHSKGLKVFTKLFLTLGILLPGLIAFMVLLAFSNETPSLEYVSYLVLICYNFFASFSILFFSRGVFEKIELN